VTHASLCAANSVVFQARLKEMKLKKKMQAKLAASGVPDYVYLNLQPQCFLRWRKTSADFRGGRRF
jgi:hypothetical protein